MTELKFKPPSVDMQMPHPRTPKYASYVASPYSHTMNTHSSIGSVKLSIYNRAGSYGTDGYYESFLLELVDGEWYVLYHVEKGTKHDELPWMYPLEVVEYKLRPMTQQELDARPSYMRGPGYTTDKYDRRVTTVRRNRPMTREEYAEWRVAVDRERNGWDGSPVL